MISFIVQLQMSVRGLLKHLSKTAEAHNCMNIQLHTVTVKCLSHLWRMWSRYSQQQQSFGTGRPQTNIAPNLMESSLTPAGLPGGAQSGKQFSALELCNRLCGEHQSSPKAPLKLFIPERGCSVKYLPC